jgi:hypothetical protein
MNFSRNACHNCARRRWRCDRSLPSCHKCTTSSASCPGYDKIFTWIQESSGGGTRRRSSRRNRGQTNVANRIGDADTTSLNLACISRPTFSHLDGSYRRYLEHCRILVLFILVIVLTPRPTSPVENRVCNDLVAHDHPGANPFRQLIP